MPAEQPQGKHFTGARLTDQEVRELASDIGQNLARQFRWFIAGQEGTAQIHRVVQTDQRGGLLFTFTHLGIKTPTKQDEGVVVALPVPHHKTLVGITGPGAPPWVLDAMPRLFTALLGHLEAKNPTIKNVTAADPSAPMMKSATWLV